jgi:hypothetical protein
MQFPDLGFGVDKRIKRRYAAFSKSSLFGNNTNYVYKIVQIN